MTTLKEFSTTTFRPTCIIGKTRLLKKLNVSKSSSKKSPGKGVSRMAQKMTKMVDINGVHVQVYALKFLAARLHRATETIRRWEITKFIPKPIFKTHDGCRWYTIDEVEVYTRLYSEEADNLKNGKKFSNTKFSERCFCEIAVLKKTLFKEIAEQARALK